MMLQTCDNYFITGAEKGATISGSHKVDALGYPPGKNNLFFKFGIYEPLSCATRIFICLGCFFGQCMFAL
jgi:hypothetical protein